MKSESICSHCTFDRVYLINQITCSKQEKQRAPGNSTNKIILSKYLIIQEVNFSKITTRRVVSLQCKRHAVLRHVNTFTSVQYQIRLNPLYTRDHKQMSTRDSDLRFFEILLFWFLIGMSAETPRMPRCFDGNPAGDLIFLPVLQF